MTAEEYLEWRRDNPQASKEEKARVFEQVPFSEVILLAQLTEILKKKWNLQ